MSPLTCWHASTVAVIQTDRCSLSSCCAAVDSAVTVCIIFLHSFSIYTNCMLLHFLCLVTNTFKTDPVSTVWIKLRGNVLYSDCVKPSFRELNEKLLKINDFISFPLFIIFFSHASSFSLFTCSQASEDAFCKVSERGDGDGPLAWQQPVLWGQGVGLWNQKSALHRHLQGWYWAGAQGARHQGIRVTETLHTVFVSCHILCLLCLHCKSFQWTA